MIDDFMRFDGKLAVFEPCFYETLRSFTRVQVAGTVKTLRVAFASCKDTPPVYNRTSFKGEVRECQDIT